MTLRHRDVAQLGSALPWGGRGREFKSHRSDQVTKNIYNVDVYFYNKSIISLSLSLVAI